MAEHEQEWIGVPEAAQRLGVGQTTIYRMIRDGTLSALRFPARIRPADLEACIDGCRIKPGQLAHLDPNARRRAKPGTSGPQSTQGVPDRRYGRRHGRPT